MRVTTLEHGQMQAPDAHPLTFDGPRGERLAVSVLEADIVRVWHMPEGSPRLDRTWMIVGPDGEMPREGRRRDDLSPFSGPPLTPERLPDGGVLLTTDSLRLRIDPVTMCLTWMDTAGREFAADLPDRAYSYDRDGTAVWHYMARQAGQHYYGFGEKTGPLDKAGLRLRMHNVDALAYDAASSDPLYKHFPFYITYDPELDIAYGLLYDNFSDSVFDMGREINAIWGPYRYYEAAAGDLDYYLIYGPGIPDVLAKLARLIGRPALLPRWALGYLGSTMFYTEMPDAQEQLKTFVAQCTQHDIPCDVFHLSSGYTTDAGGSRNVFTWNRDKLPDPAAMVDDFHRAGMRLCANVKPHLLTTHPRYDEVVALDGFIKAAEGDSPEATSCWSGGVFARAEAAYLDFTSPAGFDWWKARITDALLDYGIDGIWNDNNEFELWDDEARCAGFGEPVPVAQARPLQTLLMALASYEALREHDPAARPYLITRAGCPGVQRYAQTWSGDNVSSWHTLRHNIPMGLSLSLSGMPNTGHDVGGFAGEPPDPELFVRWVQCGIFHPRFTIHSIGLTGRATEPWMYPDVLPLIRDLIRFRYRLIPYLYTLLAESAQSGQPVIRPLVYHFPHDPHCRTESFDFMLGPNMLVAPVFEDGARTREVRLPQGTIWCDWHSGRWHEGGQTVTLDAPLDRIPLLAPAGGLVPLGRVMRYVGEQPDDVREVMAFPHPEGGEGVFTLVEDDGHSMDYRDGAQTRLTLRMSATADRVAFSVDAPQGDYPLPYDALTFVLPPGEARPLVGGEESQDGQGRRRVTVAVR